MAAPLRRSPGPKPVPATFEDENREEFWQALVALWVIRLHELAEKPFLEFMAGFGRGGATAGPACPGGCGFAPHSTQRHGYCCQTCCDNTVGAGQDKKGKKGKEKGKATGKGQGKGAGKDGHGAACERRAPLAAQGGELAVGPLKKCPERARAGAGKVSFAT